MNGETITMVRIYLSEGEAQLSTLMKRLHDWEKLRGVTVFRGIGGFGASGDIHTWSLVNLSLDLPIVVEFFDAPEKVEKAIEHLGALVKPGHLVWWQVNVNSNG